MTHGGKRTGAGRKQGAANRMTAKAREKALEGGITPLDFMLDVLRDDTCELDVRMDAAKAAAPYVHPRLANVEHKGEGGGPIKVSVVRFDHAPE